jgi:creatinine amidohydrolase
MSWKWEEMTAPEFERAVQEAQGVCVVPLGVIERHSTHLPLGNDLQVIRAVALAAAEIEPAIIFPEYYLTQVQEVKNYPGAIALRHDLILQLLAAVCEEIARNGLHKIVLLNGHGGNEHLLPTFLTARLEEPHDYTLYLLRLRDWWGYAAEDPGWKQMMASDFDYHAGEMETSLALAARPDLVRMDQLAPPAVPGRRLAHLPRASTATWWYADFPDHYAGDATQATPEKGEYLLKLAVERVAEIVKAIKEDTIAAELERDFFRESRETRDASHE